jgi:regulation of enolase protein 1 (concanavalin A-like superfamily)
MKIGRTFTGLMLATVSFGASISSFNAPVLFPDPRLNGVGIEKTMAKLTAGQPVTIVYDGQSIISSTGVVNWWPDTITKYLRARFPAATITAVNAAISGCDAKCMTNNNHVTAKLVPLDPDLIVLYIYFHLENEMEAFIKQIAEKLPGTEVVVLDFHYSLPKDTHWNADGQKSEVPWEDALSYDYLPWLCEKYGLGYLDIRTPWVRYLADNNGGADNNGYCTNASDGIHLTPRGQWLMAEFVKPYFTAAPVDSESPLVDTIAAQGKKIMITFNEKVDSASATAASSYGTDLSTLSVDLNPDKRTVTLIAALPLDEGTHAITITTVKDRAGNQIAANTRKNFTVATPASWSSVDIGRVFTPGSTDIDTAHGTFTVHGGGELSSPMNCAWGSMANPCDPYWMWRNEFRYVYKTLTGDFTLTAHIANVDSANVRTLAGIMIREDLLYLSRFVVVSTFKKDNGYFDYARRTGLFDTIVPVKPRSVKTATLWLRLSREGSTVEAFISADGANWTSEGTTLIPMTDQVTAGLFVCGNEYSRGPYRVMFDYVSTENSAGNILESPRTRFSAFTGAVSRGSRLYISGLRQGFSTTIAIFDIRGRILSKTVTRQTSYFVAIPQSGAGVYFISIHSGNRSHTLRWGCMSR